MTIEQTDAIDFITINVSGELVLTVSDHLAWDHVNEHLFQLQEKLNAYLRFVESGEVYKKYPHATGRVIVIEVVLKHRAPGSALGFFDKVAEAIKRAGFTFRTRVHPAPGPALN